MGLIRRLTDLVLGPRLTLDGYREMIHLNQAHAADMEWIAKQFQEAQLLYDYRCRTAAADYARLRKKIEHDYAD